MAIGKWAGLKGGVKKISDKRGQAAKIELVCPTLFGFCRQEQKWTVESSDSRGEWGLWVWVWV